MAVVVRARHPDLAHHRTLGLVTAAGDQSLSGTKNIERVLHRGAPDWTVGAIGTGTSQETIDALGSSAYLRAGRIVLPSDRLFDLTATLDVSRKAAIIQGAGWSKDQGFRWMGAAGLPVVQWHNLWGAVMEGVKFTNGAGPAVIPPAFLNIRRKNADGVANSLMTVRDCLFGPLGGIGSDLSSSAAVGILIDCESDANNDQSQVSGCHFSGMTVAGVKIAGKVGEIPNFQAVLWRWDNMTFENMPVAFSFPSPHHAGTNWFCYGITNTILELVGGSAHINLTQLGAEGCGRLAKTTASPAAGGGGSFTINGGYFSISPACAADGRVIDIDGGGGSVVIELKDFTFTDGGGTVLPKMRITNCPVATIRLDNVGFGALSAGTQTLAGFLADCAPTGSAIRLVNARGVSGATAFDTVNYLTAARPTFDPLRYDEAESQFITGAVFRADPEHFGKVAEWQTATGAFLARVETGRVLLGTDLAASGPNSIDIGTTAAYFRDLYARGVKLKEGIASAKMGTATLVAGTATVTTTGVLSNSRVFLTRDVGGGTRGYLEVGTIVANTSFVINSVTAAGALVADTSTVAWLIVDAI